jgi:hypothetical protein
LANGNEYARKYNKSNKIQAFVVIVDNANIVAEMISAYPST